MRRYNIELTVGVFMIAGFLGFSYLAIQLGDLNLFGNSDYHVTARFSSVAGLKSGANVELAGVKIGRVNEITLDKSEYDAVVNLEIYKEVKLQSDSIASIKTAGIIGDKYIQISPGAEEEMLTSGDEIEETEAGIDIEELVSKYIFEKE